MAGWDRRDRDPGRISYEALGVHPQRQEDELGVAHSWGGGPEVIFLSNPLADPVTWSGGARDDLLASGYQVTTFEHRPERLDWQSAVTCVEAFVARRREPVALVGWSQGAVIAQEVALADPRHVRCAALLATYGRQNEIDKIVQESWNHLAGQGPDCLRLALGLLTAFPPDRLADDRFVQHLRRIQRQWGATPDRSRRERSARFISTYQDRLPCLAGISVPCLIMGFGLDTDTYAARAREVAQVIPTAEYVELPALGHAAPMSDPDQVWPRVVDFLTQHHPLASQGQQPPR